MIDKRVLILAAAGAASLAYWYKVSQVDQAESPPAELGILPEPTFFEDAMNAVSNLTTNVVDAVRDPQVQAFLWLIRTGEGTTGQNGYWTSFGGSTFADLSDHPRRVITRGTYSSSAAGAYQFLIQTWDEMAAKYDLADFSPASQDIAAVGLIKRRGALADVLAGRFRAAIDKCNKEWASLPGSPYGQPTLSYARAQNVLASAGANILGSVA